MSKLLTLVFCGTSAIVMGSNLQAACPKLDLDTLPKAMCASQSAPFVKSGMSYFSDNAGSSDCKHGKTDFLKTLQGIFKGKKEYTGQEKATATATCLYSLSSNWKTKLVTQDPFITLTAEVTAAKVECPSVNYNILHAKKDLDIEQKSGDAKGQTFTWKLSGQPNFELKKEAIGATPTDSLKGNLTIKGLKQECTYTYHPGGKETKFTLTGTESK